MYLLRPAAAADLHLQRSWPRHNERTGCGRVNQLRVIDVAVLIQSTGAAGTCWGVEHIRTAVLVNYGVMRSRISFSESHFYKIRRPQ
jgi:hypothetical protein